MGQTQSGGVRRGFVALGRVAAGDGRTRRSRLVVEQALRKVETLAGTRAFGS
jgi:hypothetical protein